MSVLVVGDAAALALAGAPEPEGPLALVVALDDAPFPDGDAARVRWRREGADAAGDERVIAPAGEGLWSRAPWPVRDELFELPPGDGVLVVGDGDLAAEIKRRGVAVRAVDRLTAESLARADVVVQRPVARGPVPGDAMAVLAAGRILITAGDPAFGLLAGVDYLRGDAPEHAADLAQAVFADPGPLAAMRTFGRIAAERHRASAVYARLA